MNQILIIVNHYQLNHLAVFTPLELKLNILNNFGHLYTSV